ncbi:MAG: hypothetical protein ACXW3C_16580, partial [Pyrinomonadaceae bacterium]
MRTENAPALGRALQKKETTMKISTYLSFNGQCAEAIKFYEQAIGAKLLFKMTWGESPMAGELPAEMHNMIMHSTLALGEGQI